MRAMDKYVRTAIVVGLFSGCLVGISGLIEPVFSITEPSTPADQASSPVTPDPSNGSEKGRGGKGNHPMRKACAEDVKKLCSDVKAGEGRILQCLKQHSQDLSQGCADMMQQRGKHRP